MAPGYSALSQPYPWRLDSVLNAKRLKKHLVSSCPRHGWKMLW